MPSAPVTRLSIRDCSLVAGFVTPVPGSTVLARRSRGELAVALAEWAIAWRPEHDLSDEVPAWLFRPDEFETVESLTAGELMLAAGCLGDALAVYLARDRSGNARSVRAFADSMHARAERWYDVHVQRCRPRPRPRSARCRPRRRAARREARAPPDDDDPDPDEPDDVDRARRGWLR
jgi:hypothetical protein